MQGLLTTPKDVPGGRAQGQGATASPMSIKLMSPWPEEFGYIKLDPFRITLKVFGYDNPVRFRACLESLARAAYYLHEGNVAIELFINSAPGLTPLMSMSCIIESCASLIQRLRAARSRSRTAR